MDGQAAKISVDEFMANYSGGAGALPEESPPVSEKMSVDEFMAGYKAGMPAGEPTTGPVPAQEGPPLGMLGRGKQAIADFFRPSFAPEPTVPAGMEGMPDSAIPAGMEEDIPGRRDEINKRLGQIDTELTESAKALERTKGPGFLGTLQRPDGDISTELSVGINLDGKEIEVPALVPTLEQNEIDYLLGGGEPTDAIIGKAAEHARMRIGEGRSPFKEAIPENLKVASDNIENLKTQLEGITSQAINDTLPPDLYEQYTALRPQYEKAIEDYNASINDLNLVAQGEIDAHNAKIAEAQELRGEWEDLEQQEYGAEMMRPTSTVTGEPVPTFEEEAAGGRAAMAIIPYGFASVVRGLVPGALERAALDPLTQAVIGKEYVSPIDEALKIGKYLPEAGQMAIGVPAHMAGMVVPLRASSQLAGALMEAVGLPLNLVLRTGPVMDRITGHIIHGGLTGAVYGALEAGTPKGMAEDAAFFGALEGGLGAVGGIFRKIFSSNWFRNLEVSERGLVVQTADDLLKAGHREAIVLRALENPESRAQYLKDKQVLGGALKRKPVATDLSEMQRDLAKEVIREEAAKSPAWETVAGGEGIDVMSRVPAIPEGQIPLVPPGMPPSAGPLPTEPAPGVLPPGQQGFELVEPMPEVRLRPGPRPRRGPEYPEGAEYVAGRPAPEELEVEYKPMLRVGGMPWKTEDGAVSALESGEDVSRATHKVIAVEGGFGIVPLAGKGKRVARKAKPEEVKGKTLIAFVRAMGGIKDATLPGEIRALSGKETGVVGLTTSRPEKGLGFDEMASAAVEHGWLPEGLENETEAFSELLKNDLFAQKEKKPRIERLEDIAERTEREERWSEFERSEDEELEYFAKHPDKEIDADLDEWQREAVAEIRRRNEADSARKIEESVKREVEAKNSDLEGLKKDEDFPEYIEGWNEKDLLDEEALAELEAWRAGEEVPEKPVAEVPLAEKEIPASPFLYQDTIPEKIVKRNWDKGNSPRFVLEGAGDIIREFTKKSPSFFYIREKLKRINQHLTDYEEGTLHPDDSIEAAQKYASKNLEKLIDAYEKQPTETEEQGLGKSLVLALAEGKNIWARKLHDKLIVAIEAPAKKPKPKPRVVTAEMIRAELPEAVKHLPVGRLTHQDMQYAVKALGIRYDEAHTTLEREKKPEEPKIDARITKYLDLAEKYKTDSKKLATFEEALMGVAASQSLGRPFGEPMSEAQRRVADQAKEAADKIAGMRRDIEVAPEVKKKFEKPAFKIGNYVKGIDGAPSGKITHIDSDGLISVEGGPHFLPKDFRLAERPVVPLPETPPKAPPGLSLANWVKYELNQNHPIAWRDLYKAADMFYGGTQAEGKYISRHAFDAMELGMNLWVKERIRSGMDITNAIKLLDKKQQLLATQTKRTKEQLEFQQFSTPPTHSRAMAWVANIGPNDVVLDPSAGVGSLVAQALVDQPAEVIANELNARRAKLLENLGIKVYRENAAHLNAVLPGKVKPTVILMNPPFSSDILLKGKKKKTGTGAEHIEQALMRLEDGGRLVALAGRGMALDKPAFREWWKKIQGQYNIKATIAISGKEFKKFGTTFDNVLIVIDKTGPTESVTDIVIESVDKVEDVVPLLEGIHGERTSAGKRRAVEPVVEEGVAIAEGEGRPERPVRHRVDVVGAEGEKGAVQPGQLPGPPGRGRVPAETSAEGGHGTSPGRPPSGREPVRGVKPGERKPPPGKPSVPPSGPTPPLADKGRPGIPPGDVTGGISPDLEFEENKPTGKSGELTDSLFENYVPSVKVKGSQKHPAPLAESAAMAAVDLPKITYKPKIPQELIDSGKVSDAQFEFVALTGQVHEQIMPDGQRAGILNGDGTGVGKGVQQATIILDNWNHGRKKAVWISENRRLVEATKRDINWVGMNAKELVFIPKAGEKITRDEGILFFTYDTLGGQSKPKYDNLDNEIVPAQLRLVQVLEWLGKDFDGVIAFDESHNMANCLALRNARGTKPPTKKALAGVRLQNALPNARIVYASATAATEVENLAYAERLGLWGEGTAFSSKLDFIQRIKAGGVAAMEVVASNLKSMGRMVSRALAYQVPGDPDHTVTYRTLTHKINTNDKKIYDEMARAWQIVLENIDVALEETGGSESSLARRNALGQFWGAHQRFFNQVLTSLPTPTVIKDMEAQLRAGNSCVIQLFNTNEALLNRRAAQAEEAGLALEDIDLTPRDMLIQYLERSFPINRWEAYIDEDGNEGTRLARDSGGEIVKDPQAIARRDQLIKNIAGLAVPETIMERIINHFGSDSVAENTGRKKRLVRKSDGTVVQEKLTPASKARDVNAFMDAKKHILIFSNAGGTGEGYHSDLSRINQEKRAHYLAQGGWIVSRAIQGLGRDHRTNQRFAPEDILVTTDIAAHKRFFSSIARRLDQVGALTKGERKTAGQGIFSADMNLENEYADMALRTLFVDLQRGMDIEGLTPREVCKQMGFGDIDDIEGDIITKLNLTMTKFLNRLLSVEIDSQNKLFRAFTERLEAQIQYAIDQGTYETGIETLRADKIEKISEQDIDVPVGKAKYTELKLTYPTHFTRHEQLEELPSFPERSSMFLRNKRSGKLYFFRCGLDVTDAEGRIKKRVVRLSPTATTYMDQNDVSKEKYEQVPKGEKAKKIWDAQVASAPQTTTHNISLVSGTLLPIWDRLPDEIPKIIRVRTDEGEIILGRAVAPAHMARTKRALGMGAERDAEITSKQALDALLENDATLVLANNWTIKTRTVSGEDRIEITGPAGSDIDMLEGFGAFTEIISYKLRVFVPLDRVAEIVGRLIKNKPVVEIQGPRGGAILREPEAPYGKRPTPFMYSALTRAAESKKIPGKMFAEGVINRLKKSPGVKQAEIDTVGLTEWLEGKKIVTKRELVGFLKMNEVVVEETEKGQTLTHKRLGWMKRGNIYKPSSEFNIGKIEYLPSNGKYIYEDMGGTKDVFDTLDEAKDKALRAAKNSGIRDTKFAEHVLPGGEPDSYRELVLRVPHRKTKRELWYEEWSSFQKQMRHKYPGESWAERSFRKKLDAKDLAALQGFEKEDDAWRGNVDIRKRDEDTARYKSTHWPDEPNVIAHIRGDTRIDPGGKRRFHIAEFQSDIYSRIVEFEAMEKLSFADKKELAKLKKLFPWSENWHELVAKKALEYAMRNDFDGISWDTGKTQVDRWESALRKSVDKIEWRNTAGGWAGRVAVEIVGNKNKVEMFRQTIPLHGEITIGGQRATLNNLVGKELATKIRESSENSGSFEGKDLTIGGEFFKILYDQKIPGFFKKYGKKWGAAVSTGEVDVASKFTSKRKYVGKIYTTKDIEKALDVANKYGPDIWESPMTGRRQDFPINRVSVSNQLAGLLKKVKQGVLFTDAMAETSGMLADLFGGKLELMPETKEIHIMDITPAMSRSIQVHGQAVMEPTEKYRQGELDLAFGGKKKADASIESVAKKVDRVSRRRMPDRVAGKIPKSKVAEELRGEKRVDLSGRKLTKGNESQEIAELFQVYRSPKMEILHAIYRAEDGTVLAHTAMTSGNMGTVSPGSAAKYIYQMQSTAKRLGAAKVDILHNHPSGNPTMSQYDVAFAVALHRQPTPGRNALGDLMGEFIVIDHGKFTRVSEYGKDETYTVRGFYKVTPGTGEWMAGKGPRLTGPEATAAFGQSLAYDKTKACFVYVDSGNSVVGWSVHDNKILKKSVPDLEKIVRQQAKGHNASKAIIIADTRALLEPIVQYGDIGNWLLDVQNGMGTSWREISPDAFEVERKPVKPAWGLFEPEPGYGREVISKDGTSVDWDKSKVITKKEVTHKCYATYNKDGSFKKWRTRDAINKIRALKKAEVKYKERLSKAEEKFDVRVEKIKTTKEILQRRRETIRAIKEYFLLSDSDLRKISRKDIRLMSDFEFKKFKDDLKIKAEKFAERRQAMNELELLKKEKAFIAENNIRIFHKLPTIKKMTTEQLNTYAEILSKYEKGDQFLTPKRVKGIEKTLWSGSNTIREVLEKASKEFDVPLSELKGIRVDEIDRFRYDTSLARQNPFYNFMVDTINTAAIKNQFKYFKEREKLYSLARAALKSRKRGIVGRLVPRQKELMIYMEAEGDVKTEAAMDLTPEEVALADAIEDFYRRAYNWLLVNQELKSSRFADSKYVFHSKRPLSELLVDLKDTGIKSAAKDLLNRWRLDEAQFKILDSKTGEILRMKKFFRQTLYRTGELTPTKNVIKATDIYMQQFFKKMALDESVPAIETLAMALRPQEKTKTGIFLNDSLMTFVKEYLNSKKGRAINIGIQQGGKIDTVIRFVNQIISLRYIALNIPLEVAAIVGETTAKLPALGNRKLILANMRRHTSRGKRILKKYKAFTGEGVFEEVLQPARNIGENINMVLYGLFKWSRKITKQDILLGNMTKKEFDAETIDPKKLAEATKLAGRWLDIEGSKSVMGTTSTGAAITKFKGWAIPIASSAMHDVNALARTLTRLGNPKKRLTVQQFQELYRIAEMGAILGAVLSLGIDDDDKDTFVGRLKYYAIRELGTLYNALSPRTMLTFGVTIAFLEKLSQNLYTLTTLEKYKTKDEFKGVVALKKQLTPAAISQFKEKKKPEPKARRGRLRGGLSGSLPGGKLTGGLK